MPDLRCPWVEADTGQRCYLPPHAGTVHLPGLGRDEAALCAVRRFVARVVARSAPCCCVAMQEELREMEARQS